MTIEGLRFTRRIYTCNRGHRLTVHFAGSPSLVALVAPYQFACVGGDPGVGCHLWMDSDLSGDQLVIGGLNPGDWYFDGDRLCRVPFAGSPGGDHGKV